MLKLHRAALIAALGLPAVPNFLPASLGVAGAASIATFALSACDGGAEEAGEKLDDAVEEAGDKIEDATDKK